MMLIMERFISKSLKMCTLLSAIMSLLLMAAVANDGTPANGSGSVLHYSSPRPSSIHIESTTARAASTNSLAVSTLAPVNSSTSSAFPFPHTLPTIQSQNTTTSKLTIPVYAFLTKSNSTMVDEPHEPIHVPAVPRANSSVPLPRYSDSPKYQDVFLENSTTVLAQLKSNALLPCFVKSSADGVTVSWIRRKDYHLLTVGLQTYSSDDRFQAIHAHSPEDWTLKIRYVQARDAGIYECQVSTHPPQSIFVTVNVIEAHAEITGGPDKFIKSDSTLRLICELKQSTEEPLYVFWYQGLKMINYDSSRKIEVTHDRYSSTLVIYNVDKGDSGNYSCAPSNASPASIFVHIINGENPAAMQHGSHSTACLPSPPLWVLSLILSLTICFPS